MRKDAVIDTLNEDCPTVEEMLRVLLNGNTGEPESDIPYGEPLTEDGVVVGVFVYAADDQDVALFRGGETQHAIDSARAFCHAGLVINNLVQGLRMLVEECDRIGGDEQLRKAVNAVRPLLK